MSLLVGVPLFAGGLFASAMVYAVRVQAGKTKHEDTEELKRLRVPDDTLFSIFQPYLVSMESLSKEGYSSVLSLVQMLIGVQPTCDMVLGIWLPAFESYNLIVPNLLNLPELLLGLGTSSDLVSLAMYASSRANECSYCTSHCCSFAVRRGVDPLVLQNLLEERHGEGTKGGSMSDIQRSVVKVAYGLGTLPVSITGDDVKEIYKLLPKQKDVEWIVAAAAMFGSFNKLMDGLGIPLERDTYAETIEIMDQSYSVRKAGTMVSEDERKPRPVMDDWTIKLASIYHGLRPDGALQLDKKLLEDTPRDAGECMDFLKKHTGCPFEFLGRLENARIRRAVTAVIYKNFRHRPDGLGIKKKALAGLQLCFILENDKLRDDMKLYSNMAGESDDGFAELVQGLNASMAGGSDKTQKAGDNLTKLVLKVAKALSYSPSRMTTTIVKQVRDMPELTPSILVELVSFLATVQMLHRIVAFYEVKSSAGV